jgi:sugar phosphate isomerase/epimerase
MEVDFYWMAKAGQDPLNYFSRYPGRFRLCHLKDMDARAGITDVGRGRLDFQQILAEREKAGLLHYFVEHDHPRNPLDSINSSYRYLRTLAV